MRTIAQPLSSSLYTPLSLSFGIEQNKQFFEKPNNRLVRTPQKDYQSTFLGRFGMDSPVVADSLELSDLSRYYEI